MVLVAIKWSPVCDVIGVDVVAGFACDYFQ
jgi:hypothetical protein